MSAVRNLLTRIGMLRSRPVIRWKLPAPYGYISKYDDMFRTAEQKAWLEKSDDPSDRLMAESMTIPLYSRDQLFQAIREATS